MEIGVKLDKSRLILILAVFMLAGVSCGGPEKEKPIEFLLKSSLISVSESDFLDELDLKKAAYPYTLDKNPAEYNQTVIELVNMLSEEILLLSAAADLGVTVTDMEVAAAEAEFREDYPENTFEAMLLENAVPYPLWKKRLKKNLIIDKLIDQEIRHKIEITSEELVEFYRKYLQETRDPKNSNKESLKKMDETELVSVLRLQKTEKVYGDWIKALELKYPIEINKERLKSMLIDIEENKGNKNEKND
jgi:hypothetical protein